MLFYDFYGNYGFPKTLALQIAVREISTFLLENEMQIYLVVFGREAFALSENFQVRQQLY